MNNQKVLKEATVVALNESYATLQNVIISMVLEGNGQQMRELTLSLFSLAAAVKEITETTDLPVHAKVEEWASNKAGGL